MVSAFTVSTECLASCSYSGASTALATYIGRILNLHQAPVIGLLECIQYRAARDRVAVKDAVEQAGREAIGQGCAPCQSSMRRKAFVCGGKADALRRQLARQPAMAVAVNLQAERYQVGTRT